MVGETLMKGMHHPFTHAKYEQDGKGNVIVTQQDGISGLFAKDGKWIEGQLKQADPHFCGWVGGPIVANHRVKVDD